MTLRAKNESGRCVSLMNIVMELRKCCNHTLLFDHVWEDAIQDNQLDEMMSAGSGKVMLLDRMLAKLHARGHRVLLFSQMTKVLDLLQVIRLIPLV